MKTSTLLRALSLTIVVGGGALTLGGCDKEVSTSKTETTRTQSSPEGTKKTTETTEKTIETERK